MRSDFLNSILIPVQCDPIRPPRACLLTLLVAHITGTFYQTKLSVHSLWLLFQVDVYILLYVNDIYRCSEQLSFILFADDYTNIFYQHKDINVLIETLKVARYSFSRSIPPNFERKLRRHKQGFGKIDTTVVLDKDENWL